MKDNKHQTKVLKYVGRLVGSPDKGQSLKCLLLFFSLVFLEGFWHF